MLPPSRSFKTYVKREKKQVTLPCVVRSIAISGTLCTRPFAIPYISLPFGTCLSNNIS